MDCIRTMSPDSKYEFCFVTDKASAGSLAAAAGKAAHWAALLAKQECMQEPETGVHETQRNSACHCELWLREQPGREGIPVSCSCWCRWMESLKRTLMKQW